MPHLRTGLIVLAAGLAAACSGDNGPRDAAGIAEYPRPWANGPPGEALLEATSVDDVFLSYVDYVVADSEGRVYITDYQEAGVYQYPAGESLVLRGEGSVSVAGHPFGRGSFTGILGGEQIAYASSTTLEVKIVDLQGGVRTAFSFPTTPTAVTGAELDDAADGLGDAMGGLLRDGAPFVWPTLTGLVVDDEGHIWLGIHTGDPSTREWAAFTPDGTHVVSVDLPAGFAVHAVRSGRIIGVGRDELDVPRVQAYRLP